MYNPHAQKFLTQIKAGAMNFNFTPYAGKGYNKTMIAYNMQRIYNACKDKIVPFMQNDIVQNGFHHHLHTTGRHDVNSSMNYDMTNAEKKLAHQIYPSHNNVEFPFFTNSGCEIAVVFSKSGTKVTLVIEGKNIPAEIKHLFVKIPKWDTWYLKQGWAKVPHIIEILNNLK